MYLKKLCFTSLLSIGLLHAQSSVGLNVNNDDLEMLGSIDLNALTSYSGGTSFMIDAAYLHADGDNLANVGISAEGSFQGAYGLALGFGAKLVFTDDFMALPLFAKAKYTLPLHDSIPTTSLSTSFAYAPSVLAFMDAERYTEFRVEADMEVITNIHLFTGYRNIHTKYDTHDKIFNNSFYGGMKLSF
ncbi:MAG TPA: YfaZ family outer membrane protein [Sulfurovum sp.]|nr:YfaZ family outer membrane protein [Sulfurovum sp.]